ncbi:MAG TPA: hypothetical protein VGO70_03675 [Arsenicitalea sp.]|jgi:hypothetical protein|nr:hypothetical protein [Arsenicitalea sp.]
MFLVKTAFWLTVAFVVIHPKDVDLGATAASMSSRAMAAGQQLIVAQILKSDCPLLNCAPAKPILAVDAAANPSVDSPMHDASIRSDAPVPRPRPHWMG